MSINIEIIGKREVIVKKTKKEDVQTYPFNALQTPTEVTKKIMDSKDKIKSYREWAYSINPYHGSVFNKWVKRMHEEGYEIEFLQG